ncbi:UDP-glucuronic acid decarboxylase 1 [Morus notabilis]|uniref:UDP-glucuronic acid decarboxylase 1 n=1 Tax=Morus notabilis TaxID=981085 RepID=W9R6L7_9ROSA|nr:UDP-glucuronic acid decarboxylase 1 [Morus notabilis]
MNNNNFSLIIHRLLFIVIGVAIATATYSYTFTFHRRPSSAHQAQPEPNLPTRRVLYEAHGDDVGPLMRAGGKVPLGVRSKTLRIVVTGGAGFVGSHLVDRLIARGHSVIVVDNFFTGRKDNLVHHFGNPRFELIRHDVVEPILLEVDQIYHLACPASPVHYKFNPVKTIISFSSFLN